MAHIEYIFIYGKYIVDKINKSFLLIRQKNEL